MENRQILRIGWASRDVSTDAPINIPGQFHMRISRGVMDPVTVTALAIDNGGDYVIFLSADLVVIRSGLLDEIRAATARKNTKISTEKILMNATHAHTGPSHYHDETGEGRVPHEGIEIASSDEYRSFLADQTSDAICEAWEKRGPGGISYGYGYAVVAHSRRVVYFDDTSLRPGDVKNSTHGLHGHARMYGNTNDEQFSHYEAGADHFVNLLFTFDTQGKLTGALINVPCPSQNSEHEHYLSADYWHDVRTAIRARHGDIFILPQCAAGGDLSPRILHYKQAQERRFRLKYGEGKTEMLARADIGERVAACFDEVYDWAKKDVITAAPLEHKVKVLPLSRRVVTREEYETALEGLQELEQKSFSAVGDAQDRLRNDSILAAGRDRFRRMIRRYEVQDAEPKIPMEMHVLRIGDIAFASNRFELYMDYQHRIQARSPFTQTFVVQLSGQPGEDGGTYLCTERGQWGRGYSASVYCNLVSPAGGQEMVEETVKILKELHTQE